MTPPKRTKLSMPTPATRTYAPMPEHKTPAARKAREALRATTESSSYNNRSRNNLKRGGK